MSNKRCRTAYARPVPGSIQSIERAAAVLRLLAAPPGRLTLAQIVASLHLAKGTAHGIVRTLVEVGFVEQDSTSGRYRLAPALVELGSAYLDPHELRARSMNWADPLAARTGQTVQVGVHAPDAHDLVLIVHHVFRPDGSEQQLATGSTQAAHATALGKVLLAFSPSMLGGGELTRFTRRTVTDPRGLHQQLREVRSTGHAVDVEEHVPGVASIAVPISGTGGLVLAAVAVLGEPGELLDSRGAPRATMLAHLTACAQHTAGEIVAVRAAAAATRAAASHEAAHAASQAAAHAASHAASHEASRAVRRPDGAAAGGTA